MKNTIGLRYLLPLIVLFWCCSEDKGNYNYQPVNEVTITGIPKDTSAVSAEVLTLKPVFERSLQASEEGLTYSWTCAGEEIATTRDLNYTIPSTMTVGNYDCRYVVTDTKNGVKYYKNFNIHIVSTFSWGYYFLCEAPDQSAVISYFSSKEGTTTCQHTTKVGDYTLGKQPKAMRASFGNISELGDYYYTFIIVTKQGEHPAIITNNGSFMPTGLVGNSSFMFEGEPDFQPTDVIPTSKGGYFISNGKVYVYNSGFLYRAAKHDKEYYWSRPLAYDGLFVFDELSKKFYVVKNQINDPVLGLVSDPYALDRVVEIKEQPSYEGQTIIGQEIPSNILYVVTAEPGKINLISLAYDYQTEDGKYEETVTFPLATADEDTKAVLVAGNDWYFVAGNKVYTSPVLLPTLSDFVTLPDDLGKPVAMAVSAKETHLIIATYDANSPQEQKGSFVLVDLMSKEVTVHRNVMGKCVVIQGYDANPWF